MKNGTILRVVILGALSIIGIIAIQVSLLMRTWDEKEQEFHEKVVVSLVNVAKTFEKMGSSLPAYDFIKRVSSNYYVVNVNDIIDANNLDFFLRKELEDIQENFEYRIYDCETEEMVYGNFITYSSTKIDTSELKMEELPVYDEYTYYFGVRFPNRTSEIVSSIPISTIVLTSLLFVTMLFFIYTIFVILRQKQLSEMQKDFINNMTHEFKTPISTIKISADVFLNNETILENPRLHQYASIIKQQNQRLNNQVEKVLQLARIERDNFKLNKEEINLHQVLDSILQSNKIKVEEKGGTIESFLNATKLKLSADKLHLTNILHNLLDNAIKYCKEAPFLNVSTEDTSKGVLLKISDKGIGIAKEHIPKIFNKFYRVPTGNVHNVKGFGLGLFYIKNICEAHGWKIDLQSEVNEGTTVSILLPGK